MASAAGISCRSSVSAGPRSRSRGCGNTSIESGAELVESYVVPENFVVPGVGVYYASTCTQCASACGIMGRVREGRVLKLEGNPEAASSGGKICGLGQAAVQAALQSGPLDHADDPRERRIGAGDLGQGDGAAQRHTGSRRSDRPAGVVDGTDQRPPADPVAQPRRGRRAPPITSFTMRSPPRSAHRSIARCSVSMIPSP